MPRERTNGIGRSGSSFRCSLPPPSNAPAQFTNSTVYTSPTEQSVGGSGEHWQGGPLSGRRAHPSNQSRVTADSASDAVGSERRPEPPTVRRVAALRVGGGSIRRAVTDAIIRPPPGGRNGLASYFGAFGPGADERDRLSDSRVAVENPASPVRVPRRGHTQSFTLTTSIPSSSTRT